MQLRYPTEVVAGRALTLFGEDYQPGDEIPLEVVQSVKNLSALFSSRRLVPDVAQRPSRTNVRTPRPEDYSSSIRRGWAAAA